MDQPSHHFFVSYAWVDDQPFADPEPGDTHRLGWVSTFLDRFGKHLGRALGRAAEGERYWIDYEQMRGGEALGETIRAQLAGSRLLMPILSPGWFASDWCRQELAAFLELHPDAMRGGWERIFPVVMEPVERADLPPAARGAWDQLRGVLACDLWYRDADRQIRTRWFPAPDPTDRDYAGLQQDLARRMAARIRALQADEAQAGPAAGPGAAPGPPGPVLAEVSDAHGGTIIRIDWDPDRRTFATAGYDGQVGVFDSQTGTGTLSRAAETGKVASVAFTPDGRQLLTAQRDDRTLRLWTLDGPRLGAGRTIATLQDWPMWAALSPDGREAAAVGRQTFVTRYPLAPPTDGAPPPAPVPLVGHEQTVYRAIYAPNGQALATVSSDTTLRLWDLMTDQPLFRLQLPTTREHGVPLWDFDLACTADGTACWIAVPLTMGRLALYRLPYAKPPPGLAPP